MYYGIIRGENLIVAAADAVTEFDAFASVHSSPTWTIERPDVMDMLADEFFGKFKLPPFVIEGADPQTIADQLQISILGENRLASKHQAMIDAIQMDPHSHQIRRDTGGEGSTLAEMYGLDKDDPWDKRTDKQKEEDEKNREEYEKLKKDGKLSGDDSFGIRKKKDPLARVTDVRVTRQDDGSFSVDNVLAVKGLYDKDQWTYAIEPGGENEQRVRVVEGGFWNEKHIADMGRELTPEISILPPDVTEVEPGVFAIKGSDEEVAKVLEDRGFVRNTELQDQFDKAGADIDSEDLSIDPGGIIAIYFKVEVVNAKLDAVLPILDAVERLDLDDLVKRNNATGCWIAFIRKADAEVAVEALTAAGFEAEEYGVNDVGERLVPKGVTVVDTEAPKDYGIRPWNSRAAEYDAMTDDEKSKLRETYEAEEFFFCADYSGNGRGTLVHIVPKDYFLANEALFPESLHLSQKLLPEDFKEQEPGVYRTMGRDLHNVQNELAFRRKMIESMLVQVWLNQQ